MLSVYELIYLIDGIPYELGTDKMLGWELWIPSRENFKYNVTRFNFRYDVYDKENKKMIEFRYLQDIADFLKENYKKC